MIIGIASGFYNPLTLAHIDMLTEAKRLVNRLIVIVNNDKQVQLKGSIPFYNAYDRLYIIENLKCVDKVYMSLDDDGTISKTMGKIYESEVGPKDIVLFLNGGDRVQPNEKELVTCDSYGIYTVYGVGGYNKPRSSSVAIENAAREWVRRNRTEASKEIEIDLDKI